MLNPINLASLSAAGINPTANISDLGKTTSTSNNDWSVMNDLMNYSIAQGTNPLTHDNGKILLQRATQLVGAKKAHDLIDSLVIFNQRDDVKKMSGQDRITSYFDLKHSNPNVESVKDKLKQFGYGRTQTYTDSPDVTIQKQQQKIPPVVAKIT